MAVAECKNCRRRVTWKATRGTRLSSLQCPVCGGPLLRAGATDPEVLDPVSGEPFGVSISCAALSAVAEGTAERASAEFSLCRACAALANCRPGRSCVGNAVDNPAEVGGDPRLDETHAAADEAATEPEATATPTATAPRAAATSQNTATPSAPRSVPAVSCRGCGRQVSDRNRKCTFCGQRPPLA